MLDTTDASRIERELSRSYDIVAEVYDEKCDNPQMRYMRSLERQLLDAHITAGPVLDVGCGTGVQTLYLAEKGYRVVAVDISPEMVRTARDKLHEADSSCPASFVVASASDLPFAACTYSAVVSVFGPYSHVPRLQRAFDGLSRVVRADATIVMTVVNAHRARWWLGKSLRRQWRALRQALSSRESYIPFPLNGRTVNLWIHYFTGRELKQAMQRARFTVVRAGSAFILVSPAYNHSRQQALSPTGRFLARCEDKLRWIWPFKCLGDYLLLVARRCVDDERACCARDTGF